MKREHVKPHIQKLEWFKVSQKRPKKIRLQAFTPVLFAVIEWRKQKRVCAGRYWHETGNYESLQGAIFDVDRVTGWAMIPEYPFAAERERGER